MAHNTGICFCIVGDIRHFTQISTVIQCSNIDAEAEAEAICGSLAAQGCKDIVTVKSATPCYSFSYLRPDVTRGIIRICQTIEEANEFVSSGQGMEIVIKNLGCVPPQPLVETQVDSASSTNSSHPGSDDSDGDVTAKSKPKSVRREIYKVIDC